MKYWRVYELVGPGVTVGCGVFKAKTAAAAIKDCRRYHHGYTLRALGHDLEATEVTDTAQWQFAVDLPWKAKK